MRRMFGKRHRAYFTPAQIKAARFFLVHHENLHLSPTLRRVLHDAVVMERKYGWAARSAKSVIGLFLDMITEIRAVQAPRARPSSPGQALIDHLCVPHADPVIEQLMKAFGLTVIEARLLEIMRRCEDGLITDDALSTRLFVGDFAVAEVDLVKVHISNVRGKICGRGAIIDNLFGVGYGLWVAKPTSLPPSPARPEPGETTQDENEMLDYLAMPARQLALLRLMRRFGLTRAEARILQYLLDSSGGVMTYSVLHDRLYAMADTRGKPDTLKTQVCDLRRKIKGSEYSISTIWGEGLRLTITTKETANV